MEKRRVATIVVGAVVVSAVGGWLGGRSITSPAEVAARTAPPAASPILVPVEERQLTTDVVTRGTGRFGSPQKLTVAASTLKTNPGIVSDTAIAGASLSEGEVALSASGRPLFLLVGARPLSRDLGSGMTGEDVRQLEASLSRLSFDTGPIDGVYDERTETAVAALYARAGFTAFTANDEQLAQLRARDVEVVTTRADNLAALDSQSAASAKVVEARGALDDATARARMAPAMVDRATALAAAHDRAAAADVVAARAALDARRTTTDPIATAAELAAAERDLTVAQAAAETTLLTGLRDIAETEAAGAAAERDVRTNTAALSAAEKANANAETAVASRGRLVQLAQDEADLARRRAGVQVPADEIVFVATGPVRVSEVLVSKGDQANGSVMIVTDAVVSIDAGLALNDVALVKPGMVVNIDEPSLGLAATGNVKRIAATPGTNGVDGFHVYFETSVASPPPNLPGASVRLTIAVQSSGGTMLAVPVSALTLAPDGKSRVQRQSNGTTEFVDVVPGLSADGFVAVSGSLNKGDLVVIGIEQKPTPGA